MRSAVLVVDPDPDGDPLVQALDDSGFACVRVATLGEGLRALARPERFALAIVARELPDGDGLALVGAFRSSASGDAPVVVLQAEPWVAARMAALAAGADDVFARPCEPGFVVERSVELVRVRESDGTDLAPVVLVIEDDRTFAEALRREFEYAGLAVVVAADGRQGLRVASLRRPDVVVVDANMPELDGLTVIRRMRADPALRLTPCLLLTGWGGCEEIAALEVGADAYARKGDGLDVVVTRAQALMRTAAHPVAFQAGPLGNGKLLLVGPPAKALERTAGVLRLEGCDVVRAASTDEAIEFVRRVPVDCALIAEQGPFGETAAAIARLKAAPRLRDAPLVVLVGEEDARRVADLLRAGADDVMAHAMAPEHLRARTRTLLRRRLLLEANRRLHDALMRHELDAAEARAARTLADTRARLLGDLERKNRALEVTAEKLRKLSAAVEQSPMGLMVFGRHGAIEYVNPAGTWLFGVGEGDDVGRRLAAPIETVVAEALGAGAWRGEIEVEGREGERQWVLATVSPIKPAAGGDALHFACAVLDISRRKRLEALHREAEQRYRNLVEHIPAITWVSDLTRPDAVRYVSPQVELVLGHGADECVALEDFWAWIVHPEDLDRVRAETRRQLGEAGKLSVEFRARTRDGRIRWLEKAAVVLPDASGRPTQVQGVLIDVTERKLVEEALVAAKREAERAAHAKSRFLSTVSHELRTPLNAILGFGRVLERGTYGALSDRQRIFLKDILQAGEHMLRLVDDLLDLQRLREGRDSLAPAPHDLWRLVEESLRMIRPLALEKGHVLAVDGSDEIPAVLTDGRAMVQILVNILTNAVKYTPSGGRIDLRARPAGGSVVIEIEDNGVGIAPEDQERIFDYFEQVGGKEAHHMRGSGIGLALTRALVERLGGTIAVRSALGQGSVFTFTAPIADGAARGEAA